MKTVLLDKKAVLKKNPLVNNSLLNEVARLRDLAGKKRNIPNYNLEPPLGGALPKLKLYNTIDC